MRNDYPETPVRSEVVKASGRRGGRISKKERIDAYAASFSNLHEVVEKNTGLPGDEVLYYDPFGFQNGGDPTNLKKKMYDAVWSDAYDIFNAAIRKGASVRSAVETVAKEINRPSFSLPIFVSPDVTVTDERQTPFADMVARTAIQSDEYNVDEQTDHGQAERYYEPGTNGGTDETWVEADDTFDTHSYNVVPYGRQTSVTDFLQLAAQTLRSSQAITEESLMRSQRFYEENQVIRGNGDASNLSGFDTNSFPGLPDVVRSESDQLITESGGTYGTSKIREDIEYLRRRGADYADIVTLVDHTVFGDLKDDVDDVLRYDTPGDTVDFGFQALNIDGTPVMETHGAPDSDGSRVVVTLDMSETVMPMLQDATIHPLARTTPEEDMAIDSYGTLAVSSTSRIRYHYNVGQ
jgi:hypothetical protein